MDGTGCLRCTFKREYGQLAKVAQVLRFGRGEGGFALPDGIATEEADLIDRLPTVAVAHFRRAIGGEDYERDAAFACLNNGWKIIRARCARSADEERWPQCTPGQSKSKEGGRALIKDGNRLEVIAFGGQLSSSPCQRAGARSRGNHSSMHAFFRKRLQQQTRPSTIQVWEARR